jgi:hypothetical protein
MNKKIIVVIICMVLCGTIPIAAGIQPEPTSEASGIFGRTYVSGFILNLHTVGRYTSFFAIMCHYTINQPLHQPVSGYYFLQRVTFNKRFSGFEGMMFIHGTFQGTPV